MDDPSDPTFDKATGAPPSFTPYTRFAQAEAFLESHLGEQARVVLPERQRELFVSVVPWIDLVCLPFHAVGVLLLIGLSAFATLIGRPSFLSALLSLSVFALTVMALPGLFRRTRRGWELHVYAVVVSGLGALLRFSLLGLAVQLLVLWLAFQIKYRYR